MTELATLTDWPALPYEEWRPTRDTLHMYTQVIGKLRLALSPFEPQWGNVPLYVSARGLRTPPIPVDLRAFDAELDLIDHELVLRSNDGRVERRPLGGSVAEFYEDVMRALKRMDIDVAISVMPSEVPNPIPFPVDRTHETYDGGHAARFQQVLSRVDTVMREHRAHFRGRTSPVQFFWGTFDLALLRYSGKVVEVPVDAGVIMRYGGDAEGICGGWWPGDERSPNPQFFAYGYPSPQGIADARVLPSAAAWSATAGEFLLPYEAVRTDSDPRRAILDFYESTYGAAAELMGWDPELTKVNAPPA